MGSNPHQVKNTQPRMWLSVFWQRMRDSIESRCRFRRAGIEQGSTGALHSDGFESQLCKKSPTAKAVGDFLAEDEGFEPPQTESESGVLPLHKSSKWDFLIIRKWGKKSRSFCPICKFIYYLPLLPMGMAFPSGQLPAENETLFPLPRRAASSECSLVPAESEDELRIFHGF